MSGGRPLKRKNLADYVDDLTGRVEQVERRFETETAGAGGEWCRLSLSDAIDPYVVPAGDLHFIEWDTVANNFTDIFAVVGGAPGHKAAIHALEDGMYTALWGFYLDLFSYPTPPGYPSNSNIWVTLNNSSWTNEQELFEYSMADFVNYPFSSYILGGSKTFRSGPDYDPVYVGMVTVDTADADVLLVPDDPNITYFEMLHIGPVDDAFQGDPFDFITGTFPP